MGFSLLNVRRDLSRKLGMERIILDIGDYQGRPLKGKVGYFQASVQKSPARVVVDLAQLNRAHAGCYGTRPISSKLISLPIPKAIRAPWCWLCANP